MKHIKKANYISVADKCTRPDVVVKNTVHLARLFAKESETDHDGFISYIYQFRSLAMLYVIHTVK